MVNLVEKIKKVKNKYYILFGIFIAFLGYLPMIFLKKGSVFTFQDQLDGEIFTYIFAAKYLGQGIKNYPEMFNGINIDGLKMPAPIFVLLFKIFTPFVALLIMHIIVALISSLGMYLLIEQFSKNKIVACGVSIVFSYLPFYGVYGLSIMGIPFLIYGIFLICNKSKKWLGYLAILFFGISSSLVLVGYAVIINLFLICFILFLRKKKECCIYIFLGTIELSIVYLLTNISLVKQVFGGSINNFSSHKEEIFVYSIPFFESLNEYFYLGSLHMRSYQKPIVIFAILTIIFSFLKNIQNSEKMKKIREVLIGLFLYNLIISILCSLFAITSVVNWRNQVGGVLKYFQLSRISWITPAVWYFIFASILLYWIEYIKDRKTEKSKRNIAMICIVLAFLIVSGNVLYNSFFKMNVRQMVNPRTSNSITWEKYYNEELFEEIKDYIKYPQKEYRIICLGIYPAAPLYSGFYCLDGYSNNYNLEYKKEFRKIIEKELDKNEALKMYFDNWGNRCYLLSDELGQDFFYRKGNEIQIKELNINTEVLFEMGGRYLFSAVEIKNAKENELHFEKYFATEKSSICVYVYKVLK